MVASHGTIAEIFASRGEHAFRELEARAVAQAVEAAPGTSTVISLGGGAVLDSGTQQLLASCTVVYLECDADTVAERIARNSGRPLLAGDAMGRWRDLFATRQPVYERLADLVLDVRHGTVPELAHRLEDALGERCRANRGRPTRRRQRKLKSEHRINRHQSHRPDARGELRRRRRAAACWPSLPACWGSASSASWSSTPGPCGSPATPSARSWPPPASPR